MNELCRLLRQLFEDGAATITIPAMREATRRAEMEVKALQEFLLDLQLSVLEMKADQKALEDRVLRLEARLLMLEQDAVDMPSDIAHA